MTEQADTSQHRTGRLQRRAALRLLGLGALGAIGALGPGLGRPAWAQGVELSTLQLKRIEGVLALEFALEVVLPKPVQDALQRGVPVYFVAEAQLLRSRWYWRDERVARVQRSWRLAFQPLTNTWRVSLGALSQSFPTLEEAMAAVTRIGAWRIAELSQLGEGERGYYLEFGWRLDTSQLPSPMQIGLPGSSGWALGIERSLKME